MAAGGRGTHTQGLQLYTASTPSGWKASVVLEELQLPYTLHKIDVLKGDQKSEAFMKLNPAGCIPLLVDYDVPGGLKLPESGAIMTYLADAKDLQHLLLPANPARRAEVMSWVFLQADHLGPNTRRVVLALAAGVPTSQELLDDSAKQLENGYRLMDQRLGDTGGWLAAGQFTIADIGAVGSVLWVNQLLSVDLPQRYPHLHAWLQRMLARPGVRRGLNVPDPNPVLAAEGEGGAGQHATESAEVAKARGRLAKLGRDLGGSGSE